MADGGNRTEVLGSEINKELQGRCGGPHTRLFNHATELAVGVQETGDGDYRAMACLQRFHGTQKLLLPSLQRG